MELVPKYWNLTYKSDWRDHLTIELLPEEAAFLKSQIITTQRDSLFAFILKNNIDLEKYGSFGALAEDIRDAVDDELRYMMGLANDFNNLVSIITTRYNLIVFDGENERAVSNWELYAKDLKRRSEVDLKAIFKRLAIRNLELRLFLLRAQGAVREGNIDGLDDLIRNREIDIKESKRAKTNRVGEFKGQSWIGIDRLDYRYTPTKRVIRDIMNAEVVRNV